MPLYEYCCTKCGEYTEILQKMSDKPAIQCPHCHQDTLTKQISAPQFQLKGSGWYVTDFRDKKKSDTSAKPEAAETKTEAKAEAKTESHAKKEQGNE